MERKAPLNWTKGASTTTRRRRKAAPPKSRRLEHSTTQMGEEGNSSMTSVVSTRGQGIHKNEDFSLTVERVALENSVSEA